MSSPFILFIPCRRVSSWAVTSLLSWWFNLTNLSAFTNLVGLDYLILRARWASFSCPCKHMPSSRFTYEAINGQKYKVIREISYTIVKRWTKGTKRKSKLVSCHWKTSKQDRNVSDLHDDIPKRVATLTPSTSADIETLGFRPKKPSHMSRSDHPLPECSKTSPPL
jgi:hypothetical protein